MWPLIFFFIIAFFALLLVVAFFVWLPNILRFATWVKNNHSPIMERDATFASKHSKTCGMQEAISRGDGSRIDYFATFETADGKRIEYTLDKESYNLLAEGVRGTLTVQGIRFKRFSRDSLVPSCK